MASRIRLSSSILRLTRPIHTPLPRQCLRHPLHRRGYARMLASPPQAEYTFGMSWQVITPLLLLGTGSIAMVIWYFSSNEFLDAGFPPRAAEAFRIAAIAADDGQLRHSIRYWRAGLEIAIAYGISPFDDRILEIKSRLMNTIRKEGDIGAEREVLEEIRDQAIQEIRAGNTEDRGKLVSLAVQASMGLSKVTILLILLFVVVMNLSNVSYILGMRRKIGLLDEKILCGLSRHYIPKTNDKDHYPIVLRNIGGGYRRNMIESKY